MTGKVLKTGLKPRMPRHMEGREEARAAATMTLQEWNSLQRGMDAKWPLPEYMAGQKGHTAYRAETYSVVTHWAAHTRIAYRPHAKRPGSKSHVRYEEYSRATTVGEALEFGTLPADWCWDYERGFIHVLGPVRDEPVDVSKEDGAALTPVDLAIHRWYKRELSRNLGLDPKDLGIDKGCGECLTMRAHRLVSQRDAKRMLERANENGTCITDADVEHILRKWHFAKNPFRVNVMPEGQNFVFSDTLGLNRDRCGDIHLTPATKRYPQVTELISRWLLERLPPEAKNFYWTSLNLNYNYAARVHRDNGNFGPSMIKAFGSFLGGDLNYWPEDDKCLKLDQLRPEHGTSFSIKDGLAMFNGNCAHSVNDFVGDRYSVVFFTLGCHGAAPEQAKQRARDLGMRYPPMDADRYELLRPPGTRLSAYRDTAVAELPLFRYWKNSELEGDAQAASLHEGRRKKRLVLKKPKSRAQASIGAASAAAPSRQIEDRREQPEVTDLSHGQPIAQVHVEC